MKNNYINEEIGVRLRDLRQNADYSLQDIAERVGISRFKIIVPIMFPIRECIMKCSQKCSQSNLLKMYPPRQNHDIIKMCFDCSTV